MSEYTLQCPNCRHDIDVEKWATTASCSYCGAVIEDIPRDFFEPHTEEDDTDYDKGDEVGEEAEKDSSASHPGHPRSDEQERHEQKPYPAPLYRPPPPPGFYPAPQQDYGVPPSGNYPPPGPYPSYPRAPPGYALTPIKTPYAEPLKRVVAFIVDFIIIMIIVMIAAAAIIGISFLSEDADWYENEEEELEQFSIILLVIFIGYFVVLETLMKQTLGKLALGIIVVEEVTFAPLTWQKSLIRNGLRLYFLPSLLGILGLLLLIADLVLILGTDKNQRIGDKVARTVVIKKDYLNYLSYLTYLERRPDMNMRHE